MKKLSEEKGMEAKINGKDMKFDLYIYIYICILNNSEARELKSSVWSLKPYVLYD